MMKPVLFAGASALALISGGAIAKPAIPTMSVKVSVPQFHFIAPPEGGYSQRDHDGGIGYVSQNFTDTGFSLYDSAGADDFALKKKAKLTEVDADGIYFNGAGPADSFDVHYYQTSGTLPGKEVATCTGASYTDETGFGTPDVNCKASFKAKKIAWVSVVANMSFFSGGEWAWETNKTVRNNSAVWREPGGGGGCVTWCPIGADFSYAVLGKIK